MKFFILTLLLTVPTVSATASTSVTNSSTFNDESCIIKNTQALYNIDAIDEKVQDLREVQIHGEDPTTIRKATEKENKLHENITSIAYTLCD